ncbi:MAG: hypothetical protein ACK4MF_04875 [Hyphomicrobiaceae bacterium]
MANSDAHRLRVVNIGIMLVFLSILTAGFAGATLFTVDKTFENRRLAAWPKLSVANAMNGKLLSVYSDAVRDRHLFRQHAVIGRNWVRMNIFGDGSAKGLTYGADGWLFLRGAAEGNCKRKSNAETLARDIDRYLQALPASQQKVVAIFPDKEWLYPDKVKPAPTWLAQPLASLKHLVASPSFARTSNGHAISDGAADIHACSSRRYEQDIDTVAQRIGNALLDVRPLLIERKAQSAEPIYYSQDTHWTHETAGWMGGRIVERLRPGLWRPDRYMVSPGTPMVMDLSRIAGLPREFIRPVLRSDRPGVKQVKADFTLRFSPRQPVRQFASTSASAKSPLIEGRTAVVYDSFLIPSYNVISPYFENITWLFWDDFERPEVQKMIRDADRVVFASIYRLMPERAGQMAKLTDLGRAKTN